MTIEDNTDTEVTYAAAWADAINEVYTDAEDTADELAAGEYRIDIGAAGEYDPHLVVVRALAKAAACLRYGEPATFTPAELDIVRHLMPAHEVHQSGSVRWLLDNYGVRIGAKDHFGVDRAEMERLGIPMPE